MKVKQKVLECSVLHDQTLIQDCIENNVAILHKESEIGGNCTTGDFLKFKGKKIGDNFKSGSACEFDKIEVTEANFGRLNSFGDGCKFIKTNFNNGCSFKDSTFLQCTFEEAIFTDASIFISCAFKGTQVFHPNSFFQDCFYNGFKLNRVNTIQTETGHTVQVIQGEEQTLIVVIDDATYREIHCSVLPNMNPHTL